MIVKRQLDDRFVIVTGRPRIGAATALALSRSGADVVLARTESALALARLVGTALTSPEFDRLSDSVVPGLSYRYDLASVQLCLPEGPDHRWARRSFHTA